MRKLDPFSLDSNVLKTELDDLEAFLAKNPSLQERKQVLPFFKKKKHLTAALGTLNAHVARPDRLAHELDIFGDFAADAASGDSAANALTLIEFENATQHSIFSPLKAGKTIKAYSTRFEHGLSQLVDWGWRISSEKNSPAYARTFGSLEANISFMLVIGRDADLNDGDRARLRWRSQNVSIGGVPMTCYTFDQILELLRRRIVIANTAPVIP